MPSAPIRRPSPRAPAAATYLSVWAAYTFANAVAFTLVQLLYVRELGLDAFGLVLVGSVLEAACFLFGLPTGIYADAHGRGRSVVIGLALTAVGLGLIATAAGLPLVLAGIALWGVGFTFVAGAFEAWLTDAIGEARTAEVFHREQQLNLGAGIAGILVAGALGLAGPRVPIVVGAAVMGATAVLALVLVRDRTGHRRPARRGSDAVRDAVRLAHEGLDAAVRRPVVRTLLIATVLVGLSSEAFDRLWTLRILNGSTLPPDLPVETWFTAFALISSGIALAGSLLANRFAARHLRALHPRALLAGLVVVQAAGIAGLALLGNVWVALAAVWLHDAALVIARPVEAAWLNRNADERTRATLFSLSGQADALGQVAGGPVIGAVASARGVPVGLLLGAAALLPAAAAYLRARPVRDSTARGDEGVIRS